MTPTCATTARAPDVPHVADCTVGPSLTVTQPPTPVPGCVVAGLGVTAYAVNTKMANRTTMRMIHGRPRITRSVGSSASICSGMRAVRSGREPVVVREPPGAGGPDGIQLGVIAPATAGVAEHSPRLVDLLHRALYLAALARTGIDVAVGMEQPRPLEVCLPHRVPTSVARHAEHLVVRAGHRLHGTRAAYRRRMSRRRSWWGWGWEDAALRPDQVQGLAVGLGQRFGQTDLDIHPAPDLDQIELPAPRVRAPGALAAICTDDRRERASHTYGRSYRDVVRGFHGDFVRPPDTVAFPRDEDDVIALLDWCAGANVAALPYGGGSSVVGGVEAGLVDDTYAGVMTIDLTKLDRVLEVDSVSRAARIQGGALGPVLEEQLRPHGYTLRHFPQSFEFSTLGGWLATRSGGHYASVYTHIDDLVESIRMVTPGGVIESRRLPGSGAGPSPDRLALGSEGTLGVITEAWMRVQDRVRFKASAGVHFADYTDGAEATRAVAQSGLFPTNCRLLDATEAMVAAGVEDGTALLVLGFESADHPVDAWIERAVELCRDHGGTMPEGVRTRRDGRRQGRRRVGRRVAQRVRARTLRT